MQESHHETKYVWVFSRDQESRRPIMCTEHSNPVAIGNYI
jgi:hypothetical protein